MTHLSATTLIYRRDHASKAEVIEFKKEKILEIRNKIFRVWETALAERYTPVNGKYLRRGKRYNELEETLNFCQEKMDLLDNQYLALCQK